MTDLGISAKFYHFAGGQFISFIEVYCLKYSTLKLGRMVNSHLKTSHRLFCVSIFKRGHDRQQKPSLGGLQVSDLPGADSLSRLCTRLVEMHRPQRRVRTRLGGSARGPGGCSGTNHRWETRSSAGQTMRLGV